MIIIHWEGYYPWELRGLERIKKEEDKWRNVFKQFFTSLLKKLAKLSYFEYYHIDRHTHVCGAHLYKIKVELYYMVNYVNMSLCNIFLLRLELIK